MKKIEHTCKKNNLLNNEKSKNLKKNQQASEKPDIATKLAMDILGSIMQFLRTMSADISCASSPCPACIAPHMHKVVSAINQQKPITFVLPAFPGKSPNLEKVLGPLPDMAEKLALRFLNDLSHKIKELYEPGAQIILCSDGRVFSDIVGMQEEDVTNYQNELDKIIENSDFTNISKFNLDIFCKGKTFLQMRNDLMEQYGQSLDALQAKVRRGGKHSENLEDSEAHRMYCGITRFLFEDSLYPGQTKSRTAIQKDSKIRAYEVIRRSNAWSQLIAERFPNAVRLSIHPQTCGAEKLGIRFIGTESWMTPWHGVVVNTAQGFVLMKRWEAEKLSAQLVKDSEGLPSHYQLAQ